MTGTIITKKGMILIAKLLASNQELVFTRAAVGTGSAPQGWDPAGMTGLNQYKMNGKISSCHSEGEEATVVFQINSTDVESGFVITEAGLFAEDPDEGEILYAYLDLTDDPQYVYAKNSVVQKFAEIEFKTIVGAIENITVITSPDALVTKEVFEKEIDALSNPEFDDSGTAAGITGFPAFLQKVKSKMNIFEFYRNFKAGMQYVLHTGQIVNNCTSEAENLALAAAQGKVLWDRQTQLISDLQTAYLLKGGTPIPAGADLKSDTYKVPGNYYCDNNNTASTLINCPLSRAFVLKVELGTGTEYPKQTFIRYGSGENVIRTFNNSTNSWMDEYSYVRNFDLTPASITLTRTENPYMSATAFNRIQAKKIGPNLILVKFNADIDLTPLPDRAENIEVGKVNGISIVQMANFINIPAQNGSGTILLDFSDNGILRILNWSGKPVSGFVRTSFVAVVDFI